MDLLATLVNIGLVVILIVNLTAVSRLRQTLDALEAKIDHKPARHGHAHLPAKNAETASQESVVSPSPTSAVQNEPDKAEELELVIAAAVAAMLKHDNFVIREVREITAAPHSVEWATAGRLAQHSARALLSIRPARA